MIALALSGLIMAAYHRSSVVTHDFQREHHCPATDRPYGPCPGYIKDHIVPLCAGGPDAVTNMQWQTAADSKVKDRAERRQCAALRRNTH